MSMLKARLFSHLLRVALTCFIALDALPSVSMRPRLAVADPPPPAQDTSGPQSSSLAFTLPPIQSTTSTLVCPSGIQRLYLPLIQRNSTANTTTPPASGETRKTYNPTLDAPPIDPTVVTDLYTATLFIYTGANPLQVGVAPNAITPERVAVLRGRTLTRAGAPLPDVLVSIVDHPEYGCTVSRADGLFDLVVNGGAPLTVRYEKTGYPLAQRPITPPWRDYTWLEDVVLIPYDSQVTVIDFSEPIEVARGSVVSDTDGMRQATLLFPQSTQASLVFPTGHIQALPSQALTTSLSVRATEYTVGDSGPEAMPGELPANSAYTYAVEFSVDEAVAAGAVEVQFSQPVIFFVENFLDFPVGGIVPVGYYDRQKGVWIASDNGRVVKVLGLTAGLADLDTNGDGQIDDATLLAALGVTDAERQKLATLYLPGQRLWRVPITHFSPWDCNWPYGPPADATAPMLQSLFDLVKPLDDPDCRSGSIIECQNQILGESVGIVGTPFTLNYRSDRVPGRTDANALQIPLSGASIPAILKRIELEVFIAGQAITQTFPALPNQSASFIWDGKDGYGRIVQGAQPVTIRVGYVYDAVYQEPAQQAQSFGAFSGIPITTSRTRQEITFWQEQSNSVESTLGAWNALGQGMGAWTISVEHLYDPGGQVLHLGDGNHRSATGSAIEAISTVAGTGVAGYSGDGGKATEAQLRSPTRIAAGPDGSLYISGGDVIRRVDPAGFITTVAGNGSYGFSGDGGPATAAQLGHPAGIAIAPDGSLYIADLMSQRIRRVSPLGIITTVAGNGSYGFSGDGGLATQAQLWFPYGVAVGLDGSFYIADSASNRIRRVGPDGVITTVAGSGPGFPYGGYGGDGGSATQAQLDYPLDVEVGSDGSLYIADTYNYRIRRVGVDGIINTVAGDSWGFGGDGGSAINAQLDTPESIALGQDNSLYIADEYNNRIRRVGSDGLITTIAGIGPEDGAGDYTGDGGPATQAQLNLPSGVAVGIDSSLYIADLGNNRVRQVSSIMPEGAIGDILIPSEDGSELYQFNAQGRHLHTLNALTGAKLYQFSYDSRGLLVQIQDGDANITSIERDISGNPTAIVSPYGQRTTLSLDSNGYLSSIVNPANEVAQFAYTSGGLLTDMTDPRANIYHFEYDTLGRLVLDDDPSGGLQALAKSFFANSYSVTHTTSLSRTTTYQVELLPTGGQRRVTTSPDETQIELVIGTDGSRTTTSSDGTFSTVIEGPDPRWNMQAPVPASLTIATPSGLTSAFTQTRFSSLADPYNPLSLIALTDTVSINGRIFTSSYVSASQTITSTTPIGRQRVTTIDALGRVTHEQTANLAPVSYTHDSRGRLATILVGNGPEVRLTTLNYNGAGYLASLTDALGRIAYFDYDAVGRVITQTLSDGRAIAYDYDANGNLTSLVPAGRPAHTFTYTPVDLQSLYTPPNVAGGGTNQTLYSYNTDHQPTQMTRPDGQTVSYAYDSAGRLSTLTMPRGSLGYTYHPATGQLIAVSAPNGITTTYTYDGLLLTQARWLGPISGTVGYSYNPDFGVATLAVNGANTTTFQYDVDGLLIQAGTLLLNRDPLNGLLTSTSLNVVTGTVGYNNFGEPVSYNAAANGALVFGTQTARDKLGRMAVLTETMGGDTTVYSYTYDLAGRLTEVRQNGIVTSAYSYDSNSNRLSFVGPGGPITATYDAQDRLLQYGNTVYTYTANGELLSKTANSQTITYDYDELGNLMSVVLPGGTQIEYLIDGQNRRIGKKVNGVLVQGFLYQDSLNPIAELNGSNNIIALFVYGSRANVPDYMVKGGLTYRILSDHLDSPRLVVNAHTGAIAQRMDYDAFGRVILDTNPGFQPFGFAGGIYDSHTKLTRFGARDYDAEIGRWTAKDPTGFAGEDTNLYGYVMNDPVNSLDSTGLQDDGNNFLDNLRKRLESLRPRNNFDIARYVVDVWEQVAGQLRPVGEAGTLTNFTQLKYTNPVSFIAKLWKDIVISSLERVSNELSNASRDCRFR